MAQLLSILNRLTPKAGGITRVCLSRSEMLAIQGHDSKIALLEYDPNLDGTMTSMLEDGRLSPHVYVLNFYTHYASKIEKIHVHSKQIVRTFEYVGCTGLGIVRYFTPFGFLFVEEILDKDKQVVSFTIFSHNDKPRVFNSKGDAHRHWIQEVCNESLPAVVIADPWRASSFVANLEGDGIKKVLIMHSNHLNPPYTLGSVVKASSSLILKNLSRCDALVVLTEAQRTDINHQFGCNDKIFTIGNPLTNFNCRNPIPREDNLAVVISRLNVDKRVPRIVRMFKDVVEIIPSATLEIWGEGVDEVDIRKSIIDNGLDKSVFLCGHTSDPSVPFRRSVVSLSASEHEGFGLTFMESLSLGTPSISFRSNYGPEEIITHGSDGFVVDTEEDFVDGIISIMNNSFLFEKMSSYGQESVERFSHENISKKWLSLIDNLIFSGEKRKKSTALRNSRSSAIGTIFIQKDDIENYEFTSIRILSIDYGKKFKGVCPSLGLGIYEVVNIRESSDGACISFNIKSHNYSYSGAIPIESISFDLLN